MEPLKSCRFADGGFEMHRLEGRKYVEIATQLSLSVKTVEAEMTKALRTLREEVEIYIHMK